MYILSTPNQTERRSIKRNRNKAVFIVQLPNSNIIAMLAVTLTLLIASAF